MVGPVGVKPTVKLNAPRMRFFDRKLQRVPHRVWRSALLTGEVFAPRFQFRGIEGVAVRPDLEHERVQMKCMRIFNNLEQLGLLLRRT